MHDLILPPLPDLRQRWAIFVDIDGTLVDFASRPDAAYIAPTTLTQLANLVEIVDGAFAVLSGRQLADVDQMMSPLVLPVGALHGIERRGPDGIVSAILAPPAIAEDIRMACSEGIKALDGVILEVKAGRAFAMHYRQALHHEVAVQTLALAIAAASHGQYAVQAGNCVAELIPPGRDKGSALRALMQMPPFFGRRPIFLGDDLTDESAFIEVKRLKGMAIIVGKRRPTNATYALTSPSHAIEWLNTLAQHLDSKGTTA